MKFCKNLQQVVDISDPEWAPYWTNYKMLKKLIKELPSLVPAEEAKTQLRSRMASQETERPGSPSSTESSSHASGAKQQHGDKTGETAAATAKKAPVRAAHSFPDNALKRDDIKNSPGEVAFFKLLHAEYKKATHFFGKALQEFVIREERVREGIEIMKNPSSIMVNEKWSLLAKSLYRLYKDLLLLETFAIMTYCSFSKILKKHDKVTGYNTRQAFMSNVVSNANFSNYPVLLEMIARCERMYEEVSQYLMKEGKEGLYEDERLFINMIHRLNGQVMDTAESEGVPERKEYRRENCALGQGELPPASAIAGKNASALRTLVAEMDTKNPGQVSEGVADDLEDDRKRPAVAQASLPTANKRPRTG